MASTSTLHQLHKFADVCPYMQGVQGHAINFDQSDMGSVIGSDVESVAAAQDNVPNFNFEPPRENVPRPAAGVHPMFTPPQSAEAMTPRSPLFNRQPQPATPTPSAGSPEASPQSSPEPPNTPPQGPAPASGGGASEAKHEGSTKKAAPTLAERFGLWGSRNS